MTTHDLPHPIVIPPGKSHVRVTTIAKTLDDMNDLLAWKATDAQTS